MLKMEKEIKPIYESELNLYNEVKNNQVLSLEYFDSILTRLDDVIISLLDMAYNLNDNYKEEIRETLQLNLEQNKPWNELKELLESILLNLVVDKMGNILDPIIEEADKQGHIPHIN